MLDKVLRFFRSVSSGRGTEAVDRSNNAIFVLVSGRLPMLVLSRNSDGWTMRYTDAFKDQSRVAPLVPFPDVNKVYRSQELWPFFRFEFPVSRVQRSSERSAKSISIMTIWLLCCVDSAAVA